MKRVHRIALIVFYGWVCFHCISLCDPSYFSSNFMTWEIWAFALWNCDCHLFLAFFHSHISYPFQYECAHTHTQHTTITFDVLFHILIWNLPYSSRSHFIETKDSNVQIPQFTFCSISFNGSSSFLMYDPLSLQQRSNTYTAKKS